MDALAQVWIPATVGAFILGTLLGVLRWKFGNSIIVVIMVWVALLVEFMATVAYTMGRIGFHLSTMAIGFVLGTSAIDGNRRTGHHVQGNDVIPTFCGG